MKFKKIIKEVLKDPRHWIGWGFSSLLIAISISIFFLGKIYFFGLTGAVFLIEVISDIIKHWLDFQ